MTPKRSKDLFVTKSLKSWTQINSKIFVKLKIFTFSRDTAFTMRYLLCHSLKNLLLFALQMNGKNSAE